MKIYTIGHSTHPWNEFIDILKSFHILTLIDVRTIPKSKFNPQFTKEHLSSMLPQSKISYQHIPGLGGLRHAHKDSINKAWRNTSFRGYADYMQTSEFQEALQGLLKVAQESLTAIMCAEAVPWRCHRSLIADALVVRKIEVKDIFSKTKAENHKLNPMAKVHKGVVYYPLVDNNITLF